MLWQMAQMPVLPLPTFGGKQLWGDVFLHAGYRIQQNVWTRHHRLLGPNDLRLAFGTYEACAETFDRLRKIRRIEPESDHLVLLLHGIFRSKDSFGPMRRGLRSAGYEAHAVNYPSTRQSLEDHADQVELLLERAQGARTVSFVTHSMGGLVARVLLGRRGAGWRERIQVNRLVMIATPNHGSEIAYRLDDLPAWRAVAGPAFSALTPDRVAEIPVPTVPFGLVAGGRGTPQGYNPMFGADNDMTVAVDEVRLDGAEDFLVVPAIHTFVMIHPDVVQATIRYLTTGRFGAPPA